MRYNFTATENSISMYFAGRMHSIPKSDGAFAALFDHLKLSDHDYDVIESLINKPLRVARLTAGLVTVVGSTVYFRGDAIHSTLTEKLIAMLDMGFDVKPWARFMENVMANPSEESRNSLYDFLDHWQAPITEDGCFLAFKRVRKDYKDIYSGKFDNSPGTRVEIPREKVDPNRNNQCSYGLHVAASSYLNSYASAEGNNTVVVKVNPADVIAVPADYKFAKMRVAAYEVIGDAEEADYNEFEKAVVVTKYDPPAPAPVETPVEAPAPAAAVETPKETKKGKKEKLIFTHGNVILSEKELINNIKAHGQRGYSRLTGIPRTTLQDWLTKVRA